MTTWKPLPEFINGFKVIKDLGIPIKGKGRHLLVLCPICQQNFTCKKMFKLTRDKSCGCSRYNLKPLPNIIGVFQIIKDLGRIKNYRWVIVKCPICKNEVKKRFDGLDRYDSCGCDFYTPGISRRLQRIHNAIMARCYRKTQVHYNRYGGRGIITCKDWKDSKKFYKWALENGYKEHLTIDRIDNDKGYYPENCRWVTQIQQGRNRKNNVVTEEIAKQIQAEPWRASLDNLCKKYGLKKSTIKGIKYKQVWKGL